MIRFRKIVISVLWIDCSLAFLACEAQVASDWAIASQHPAGSSAQESWGAQFCQQPREFGHDPFRSSASDQTFPGTLKQRIWLRQAGLGSGRRSSVCCFKSLNLPFFVAQQQTALHTWVLNLTHIRVTSESSLEGGSAGLQLRIF